MRAVALALCASIACTRAEAAEPPPLPTISVGLLAGEPIGVTALVGLGDRLALHVELGPSTADRIKRIGAIDLVFLLPDVFGAVLDGFLVPWIGVGPRYAMLKQLAHSTVMISDTRDHFGLRAPFGTSFFTTDGGVELFVEVAPGLAFVPSSLASVDGGVGIRLAF
jgi:hypothetical protein